MELQAERRHLLLCGDPVAAGEVLAAPSAAELDGVAVCLLDLSPEAQTSRLAGRGDDPTLLADHHAFADWMRGHDWSMDIVDASELAPHEVAAEVVSWCRRALHGQAPVMHATETPFDR